MIVSVWKVKFSYERFGLSSVAQDYARDYGITLPDAMTRNRGKERYEDRAKSEDLHEKQQQERTGITKAP